MRLSASLCSIVVVATAWTPVHGSPIDNAIVAAMQLRDANSYQWISTVEDDSRFYTIEGKTRHDGYTLVNMPMVNSIQQKLGGSVSDVHRAVFKGYDEFVIETTDGWKSRTELASIQVRPPRMPLVNRKQKGAGSSGPPGTPGDPGFRYSNLQLNLSHPHDELGIIVGNYAEIRLDDAGVVSGTLSEEGAKLLLVHPGQNEITPLHAIGTFRFWLKGGVLVKYEVQLSGTIAVGVGPNRWEIALHQTVTTDLRDVGSTSFEIPEEAKRKLG